MKIPRSLLFTFLLLACITSVLRSEELSYGDPLKPSSEGCEITWAKDLRQLPDLLPHYSAGDHKFTQKVIQYFKKLGNFTPECRIPPLEHWHERKDVEIYEKEPKHLHISPMTGCLIFRYSQEGSEEDLSEAPVVENAKEMAKKLLTELGFDLASLSFDHVRYTSGTRTRFDRTIGKAVTSRTSSGMFIPRVYEGQPSQFGGVNIAYGLGGILTDFSICWRDVELAGQRKIPTRDEIAKQILEGRATVMMDAAQNTSRLTVKKISVIYREAEPFKKANTVEPVLLIKADAEVNGVTADCTIYLKLQ